MPISPRHFTKFRWLLVPTLLVLVAAVAWLGTELLHWRTPRELALLFLLAVLIAVLAVLWYRRIERTSANQALVSARERRLTDQERGRDRLYRSFGKRSPHHPGHGRWLALAERLRIADPAVIERWERRYQELRADPKRSSWAEQALQGNFPDDLQIDYLSDPRMLLTCEHLQALEQVLRESGVPCGAMEAGAIRCDASLQAAAIRSHFLLANCVTWVVDPPSPHRDETVSALVCQHCHSRIESGQGAPFPDPNTASGGR